MKSMRERIALWLINILMKGEETMMAMLYASKIVMEATNPKTKAPWKFEDVPAKLRNQVAEILINECGLPELVPAGFGGTAETA